MTEKSLPKVTIVGGGFSGLTLAYFLLKQGFKVQIFEKKKWGGLISTKITPQMQAETAANGFLNSELVQQVANDIHCELQPTLKIARNRFIFRGGLRQWPLGLRSSFTFAFMVLQFIFAKDKVRPKSFETVADWARRVLNSEILDYLLAPALQGIYAGHVEYLSASLILGSFFEIKPKKTPTIKIKKGTVAPAAGLEQFIQDLKKYLQNHEAELSEQGIENLDSISKPYVLALPPWEVAKLYDSRWGQLDILSLLKVTVSFESPQKTIPGFGVLFPTAEKFNCLGALSNSNIFSGRGSLYNESWILGGAGKAHLLKLSDQEILELIQQDRQKALGALDPIATFEVVRWPQGLTHYTVAHEKFLADYKSKDTDVFLTGNYLGRLGLSKILEYNQELAKKLKEQYG